MVTNISSGWRILGGGEVDYYCGYGREEKRSGGPRWNYNSMKILLWRKMNKFSAG